MKRKILMAVLCVALCGTFAVGAAGCGKKETSGVGKGGATENETTEASDAGNTEDESEEGETKAFLDDNEAYFIMIDGQKYFAGDKLADMLELGYSLSEGVGEEEVPANTYMIGAGYLRNEDGRNVLGTTPFNPGSSPITVAESVIGGISLSRSFVGDDEKMLNAEIYGGIKLGSTEEEVREVFGEPSHITEGDDYKTFRYESNEVYRSFTISLDENGLVDRIEWKNLVFSE